MSAFSALQRTVATSGSSNECPWRSADVGLLAGGHPRASSRTWALRSTVRRSIGAVRRRPGSPTAPGAITGQDADPVDMDRRVVGCAAGPARRRVRGRARWADGPRHAVRHARDRSLRRRRVAAGARRHARAGGRTARRDAPRARARARRSRARRQRRRRRRGPPAHGRRALRRARSDRAPDRHAQRPAALLRVGHDCHPRARGLGRHDRFGPGARRRGRHRDRCDPSGPRLQRVDQPGRVGRRARDQRPRRRRQRPHRRRPRLGLRRPGRAAPGRQRARHPRLGHDRRAWQRRQRRRRAQLVLGDHAPARPRRRRQRLRLRRHHGLRLCRAQRRARGQRVARRPELLARRARRPRRGAQHALRRGRRQ